MMEDKFIKLSKDPLIFENFISKDIENKIERVCEDCLQYFYNSMTSKEYNERITGEWASRIEDGAQYVSSIYNWEDKIHNKISESNQSYYEILMYPFITSFFDLNLLFDVKNLIRVKINMQMRDLAMKKGHINAPHADLSTHDFQWLSGVYYVNDSDGDFHLFNETFDDLYSSDNVITLSLKDKITPKKGTLILFNGKYLHAGSHPMVSKNRIVINFNYRLHDLVRY